MALYRAKVDGREPIASLKQKWTLALRHAVPWSLTCNAALLRGEFEVYYQPIYELTADRISGFEALVRWKHPLRGMVEPAEFIPLAEETGLIIQIGDHVLRTACAAAWSQVVRIAVNLSPAQFKNRNLVPSVISAISSAGLAPDRLELEITEIGIAAEQRSNARNAAPAPCVWGPYING